MSDLSSHVESPDYWKTATDTQRKAGTAGVKYFQNTGAASEPLLLAFSH